MKPNKYISLALFLLIFSGCSKQSGNPVSSINNSVTNYSVNTSDQSTDNISKDTSSVSLESNSVIMEEDVPATVSSGSGKRDNRIVCLIPTADGTLVSSNSVANIDYSNASEGYVAVSYSGTCGKVKLQITRENSTTYTYNLTAGKGYEFFPLSSGSGNYSIAVYENVYDNQYATALSTTIDVTISNTFGPNLYPNQYVNFTEANQAISKAAELALNCSSDLDVVTSVYNYVVSHISYDYDKAATVQSGYTCSIDETLKSGTGICLDYASVLCAMLRSQRIPTRLEVGYAGTAYHAWISTYIDDIGWVNGMIEFDGQNWSLMDPTFASTTDPETLKNFLDDSSNYQTKYIY